MKERPILFSAPMVKALLAGTKTQTRRIVKPQPTWDGKWFQWNGHKPCSKYGACGGNGLDASWWMRDSSPYGVPGDRLWVRETFAHQKAEYEWTVSSIHPFVQAETWYRADFESGESHNATMPWKPSIHMPRALSRIDLEVTGIRVERLQDISQQDCVAEGMPESTGPYVHHVIADYRKLWTEINGPDSWDANPWVWVVEFSVVPSL